MKNGKQAGRTFLLATLVAGLALIGHGKARQEMSGSPSSPLACQFEEVSYQQAVNHGECIRPYLNQFFLRRIKPDPSFDSILELRYTPHHQDFSPEPPIAGTYLGDCILAQGCPVQVYPYAFNSQGPIRTEEDLVSVLDNEVIHTRYKRERTLPFPYFTVSSAGEATVVKTFLEGRNPKTVALAFEDMHSSLHQLLMITTGKRVVSESQRQAVMGSYIYTWKVLLRSTEGTEHEPAIELLRRYISLDQIAQGKVSLPPQP